MSFGAPPPLPPQALEQAAERLSRRPGDAGLHGNFAAMLSISGETRRAVHHFRRALLLEPRFIAARLDLAELLDRDPDAGPEAALDMLRDGLALDPDATDLLESLARKLADRGRSFDAAAIWNRLAEMFPAHPAPFDEAGIQLRDAGRPRAAIPHFRRACDLAPDNMNYRSHLVVTLGELGELEESLTHSRELVARYPHNDAYASRLGATLSVNGQPKETIKVLEPVLARNPDHAEAAFTLAVARLLTGDLGQGFKEYECRFRRGDPRLRTYPTGEHWTDQDPTGKTILVYPEQGLGDLIQFVRYLPRLAERTGQVIFDCPHELLDLFKQLEPAVRIRGPKEPLPACDLHVPLLNLSVHLGLDHGTLGSGAAYFKADPAPLPPVAEGAKKIGLVWAGSPGHVNDLNRSMRLEDLSPVLGLPHLRFFALQKGPGTAEIVEGGFEALITPLGDHLKSFMDTARFISALDAVVTVDTAVAHLSGALGKPVHVLVPYAPDWRWGQNTDSSTPWYDSMTLYRQDRPKDWTGALDRLAADLSEGMS